MMKQALQVQRAVILVVLLALWVKGRTTTGLNGWACVGKLAQALLNQHQTNWVKDSNCSCGVWSSFGAGGVESDDVKDAKDWGVVGDGGWIAGSSPEDVSDSINKLGLTHYHL